MRNWLLFFVLLGTLLCATTVIPVSADAPLFETVPLERTTVSSVTCGFPIENHTVGVISFIIHISHDQSAVRSNRHVDMDITFTNLANGKSVQASGLRSQNLKWDYEPPVFHDDGSITFHDRFVGLSTLIVIPGTGPVVLDVGSLDVFVTLAADASVIADLGYPLAGHWDRRLSTKICDLLS